MKMLPLLWVSIIALTGFLTGCSKEPDVVVPPTNEELISGMWYLTSIDASGTIAFGGNSIPFVTTGSRIDSGSFFNFLLSPSQMVSYDASAEVDVSAGTIITVPYQRNGTGTWEFLGNDSLIITESGQITRYGILSWTDSKMILRSNQEIDISGQGISAKVEAVIER